MKKKLILLILLLVILTSGKVYSQTKTASTTPEVNDQDIKIFKEKIANVVKKNNKAISGFVISNDNGIIEVKSSDDLTYEVKLDTDLTKYFQISGTQKKEIKSDNIEIDDFIIVTGVITDKSVAANAIFIDEKYIVSSGRITEVNKENYSIKLTTNAKETLTLDIETSTKQYLVNIKTNAVESTGFSKIKEGDIVHYVIKKTNTTKESSFSAQKILIIPQEYFLK